MLVTARQFIVEWEKTYAWSRGSGKDQGAEISRPLIAESSCSVDEGTDPVRLEGRADERRAPRNGGAGGLLRLEELLLRVGGFGPLVGRAEERRHDGEFGGMVEDGAEGDSRWLDSGEIYGKGG